MYVFFDTVVRAAGRVVTRSFLQREMRDSNLGPVELDTVSLPTASPTTTLL